MLLRCSSLHRFPPLMVSFLLQVICEKIFRPWFSPTLLGPDSKLPLQVRPPSSRVERLGLGATPGDGSSPVLQVELQRAVQECSETAEGERETPEDGGGEGGRRGVHQRLLDVLTLLLQEGEASGKRGGSRKGKGHAHTALNF